MSYGKASKQQTKNFTGISTATIYESSNSKNALDSKLNHYQRILNYVG